MPPRFAQRREMSREGLRISYIDVVPEEVRAARDLADGAGGDTGIEHGGLELGVLKEDLNHPDIHVLLTRLGEAVGQGCAAPLA